MRQRKALLALAMLLALLAFNTEVQAKGGRGGGGGRSGGGHRSSSGGGGFFSGWGSKSKSSSSSSNSGGGSGSNNGGGGGFFSNWGWGAKSKSSSSSSQKNSGSSSSSHSSPSKPHEYKHDLHQDLSKSNNGDKSAPPIGWNVGAHNSHLHHPIMPSSLGHNHVNPPLHGLHAVSYPRQPVFMSSSVPGAPPPPPPPYGGYYASSSSLPVGATFYSQVPRKSSDSGFGSGFFAGAYGQSILNRLSHVHYYGGHRSVIHNHDNNYDNNNNNKMDNNSTIDRIIIINNNPTTTGEIPLELGGAQFNQTQPILRNEQENTTYGVEANSTNLSELTDAASSISTIITNTVSTDQVDVNAQTTTTAKLSENISSTVASNDVSNNSINTPAAAPGGIICFPSMVNETDAQDPDKVLQVEKIFCFPAEPPAPTVEELKIIQEQQQHQPPEQPNILKEDVQYLDIILSGGLNNKGSFQLAGISVFLLISLY